MKKKKVPHTPMLIYEDAELPEWREMYFLKLPKLVQIPVKLVMILSH